MHDWEKVLGLFAAIRKLVVGNGFFTISLAILQVSDSE